MKTNVIVAATVPKPKIVKKHAKAFKRHHSDRYARISRSGWRLQKGIDSAQRRRFRGCTGPQPNIGFGSNKKTKFLSPNGLKTFLAKNEKDLDSLLMTKEFAVTIASAVSARKRVGILEKAKKMGLTVTNAKAKLHLQA